MEDVCINLYNDPKISKLLQEKAFEAGFIWTGEREPIYFPPCKRTMCCRVDKKVLFNYDTTKFSEPLLNFDQALDYFRKLKEENEKPRFKVGDWVWYITQSGDGSGSYDVVGKKKQLICIEGIGHNSNYSGLSYETNFYAKTDNGGRNLTFKGIERLATPEEIKASQKITIVGLEVKKTSISTTKVGCEHHNDSDWESLYRLMKDFNLTRIYHKDGTNVPIEEMQKLINWIERQ